MIEVVLDFEDSSDESLEINAKRFNIYKKNSSKKSSNIRRTMQLIVIFETIRWSGSYT